MKDGKVFLSASPFGNGVVDGIPQMSIHYVEMKPGEEVKPHTHNRAEAYLFLTGRAIAMTGDDIIEVTTGDVAFAPVGVPHAIRVLGNEPLRFYAFNAPPSSTSPMKEAPEESLWKWNRMVSKG
jgi:mannose-6-phosphate isomerase-like protein (cupin superfamily)